MNHPAWSLGHLVLSCDQLAQFVGQGADLPDGSTELFKAGSTPATCAADYSSKEALLAALTTQHARVVEALTAVDQSTFSEPHPDEDTRKYFSTRGDMIIFLMVAHEMDHLGQIVAWRRAAGLGSATSA